MTGQIPKPFDKFRDSNGIPCQMICIAKDAGTQEEMAVYQALSGDYGFYIKPLEEFLRGLSQKDSRQKDSHQEFLEPKPGEADPALLAFLDADTMEEKSNVLTSIRHRITDRLIDDFAVSLDVVIPEGDVDLRYQKLLNSIRMMQKYETERLR